MYNLSDFIKEHELKLGDGEIYNIKPEPKFGVLREALKNYYETYKSGWGDSAKSCHFTIINNTRVELTSANGHKYIMNCYSCIIQIQMFLELYIGDILEEVHPILTKGRLNKEIDLLNAITWKFDDIDFKDKQTIIFSEQLKRLVFLIINDAKIPEKLRLNSKYHFFSNHIDTINHILELRNIALHKGRGLLKDFALDVFWINHIVPLIIDILKLEERMPFLDRNTHCGITVLSELNKLKLDHDYRNISKVEEFIKKLNYICHLKELGRASFNNYIFMAEYGDSEMKKRFDESSNKNLRELSEGKADLYLKNLNYYEIHTCPCCGLKALVTNEYWYHYDTNKTKVHKAECLQCSYSIGEPIGNPREFGLMEKDVFVFRVQSKYVTGIVMFDANYTNSFNNPIDHTVVGSAALARNNEMELSCVSLGGEFNYLGAHAKILTQFGTRSTVVPRNDYSSFRGQYELANVYRYMSEAYAGYHFNVLHGINVDAGMFMSYLGLNSYCQVENWEYQAFYTSDNTPWFFNGIRAQIFLSKHLKIEPWTINGYYLSFHFYHFPFNIS